MAKKYKILKIDDDQQSVIKLSEYINKNKLPYELITVDNTNQIQETIRDYSIDLIISESKLNGSSIFDFPELFNGKPVILVTQNSDESTVVQALRAGVSDYLKKEPQEGHFHQLLEVIERTLNLNEQETKQHQYQQQLEQIVAERTHVLLESNQRLSNEAQQTAQVMMDLNESWEIYRRFFQASPDPVFITTEDGRWIDMNQAALQLFGYNQKEDIWNDSVIDLYWDPNDRKKYIQALIQDGCVKEYPITLRKKDGSGFEALISATPFDIGGKTIGFQGFVQDISQEMQAEKEKNQLLEKQKILFQESEALVKKFSSLQRIEQTVLENLSLPTTLDVLIDLLVNELGVDAGDILYFHPSLKTLKFITQTGFRQNILQHTDLEIGEGLAGEAAETRKVVYIQDLTHEESSGIRSLEFTTEKFVTYIGVPLLTKGRLVGVLEIFNRSILDPGKEWFSLLEMTAGLAAIAIDIQNLHNDLERSRNEINKAFDELIEGWALALELRGIEDVGHSRRTKELAINIAKCLGLKEDDLVQIRRGALLHDIGKMGIPDQVLLKGSKLTKEERKLITKHPVDAFNLLNSIELLRPALDIPLYHHERWDGEGYPYGISGEEIPLSARIFAIVDVWDAMLTGRPYRDAYSREDALKYIQSQSGKHFDPEVVRTFLEIINEDNRNSHLN